MFLKSNCFSCVVSTARATTTLAEPDLIVGSSLALVLSLAPILIVLYHLGQGFAKRSTSIPSTLGNATLAVASKGQK